MWWHIGSHTEFMKTEVFTKGWKLYWESLFSSECQHCTTGESQKPERVSARGRLAKNRDTWVALQCSHHKCTQPSLCFPHCICLLWIKFEISSPDMWHFTLCSFSDLAHLFWGNLAPATDSSWKFSGWTGHQCTLISAELQVEAHVMCPAYCLASVLTTSAIITKFTSPQGPPWFLHVPSSPSYCWDKIPWLVCIFQLFRLLFSICFSWHFKVLCSFLLHPWQTKS